MISTEKPIRKPIIIKEEVEVPPFRDVPPPKEGIKLREEIKDRIKQR